MNNFNFTGNIGKDCSVRQAGSSTVCVFPVAVTTGYGDKEKTMWTVCEVWGKCAEGGLPQYLVKGQKVVISGELSLDEYEKDGEKRHTLKVNVNSLDLLGDKKESAPQATPSAPKSNDDPDDDIPF